MINRGCYRPASDAPTSGYLLNLTSPSPRHRDPKMIAQPVCSPDVWQLEVSVSTYTIAGISVHVYGLEQLPENKEKDIKTDVSCLYLLSPRLCDHTFMTGIARTVLYDYYNSKSSTKRGLICVAFDPRNHGEREVCIYALVSIGEDLQLNSNRLIKRRTGRGETPMLPMHRICFQSTTEPSSICRR